MKDKQKALVLAGVVAAAALLFAGGRGMIEYTKAAEQAELERKQAQMEAELAEAAAKEQEELAKETRKYELAISSPEQAAEAKKNGTPAQGDTVVTEEDGSITITPDFEAQAAGAARYQEPGQTAQANLGGSAGGELPLAEDGAYHGDHPAIQETQKPTEASEKPQETTGPEATQKPAESSEKPQETTGPKETQKPAESSEKPQETQKPAESSKKPVDWWDALPQWDGPVEYRGGNGADLVGVDGITGHLTGHQVGNM